VADVIGVIGAAIVIASAMIAGLRLENLILALYPPADDWLPHGIGSLAGLVAGVAVVASWLT
jgi:hypothetical protein